MQNRTVCIKAIVQNPIEIAPTYPTQSQKAQGFHVADFAMLCDERRSRPKIFLLFNMDKRTLSSKI